MLPGDPVAAQNTVDVLHYDMDVTVEDQELIETVTLTVRAAALPKRWTLVRANAVKVLSAVSAGKKIPLSAGNGAVHLDLSGLGDGGPEALQITLTARGRPHKQFTESRGGFVRTCVSPEITYIRSQYAWYPRVRGDVATYKVTVRARKDWAVRTAGVQAPPESPGDRTTWVFEQKKPVRRIGLVAGPYKTVELKGVPGMTLDALVFENHVAAATALLEAARRAYAFYSKLFGPVEASRFTLVEMPPAFGKGSGYGEAGYSLIGEGAFQAGRVAPWAVSLVAHEVSHVWWGHEVMFSNFANEALACYSTLRFLQRDAGEEAARSERLRAVRRVHKAAAAGKEIRLGDIRGWGSGVDPMTYDSHAYRKGMMLIAMVERAAGEKKLTRALARLFKEQRGKTIDYAFLSKTLARCGGGSRAVVTQWEEPGIPELKLDHRVKPAGKRFKITGTLTQEGTRRPFKMNVELVAMSGEKKVVSIVKLAGARKKFNFTTPFKPDKILVDPDYRLLARRPSAGPADPGKEVGDLIRRVVNSGEKDPEILRRTVARLTDLVKEDLDPGKKAVSYTGIGRCHFRLGEHDQAIRAFKEALKRGAGGPFHRAWIYLRLGNIADLRKDRKKACAHYEHSVAQGLKYWQAQRAKEFLTRPYRGYEVDR